MGVVECLLCHATQGVGIRGKFLLLRNRGLIVHVGPSMCKGKFGPHGVHPRGLRSGRDYCMCRDSCSVYPRDMGILGKLLLPRSGGNGAKSPCQRSPSTVTPLEPQAQNSVGTLWVL